MLIITALLCASAFLISYISVPLTVPLCRITGAIDTPDGVRKLNTAPIPRLGGIAIYAAVLIVLFPFISKDETVGAILAGGAILLAGGVCDDTYDLSPIAKLVIQLSAAAVAIAIAGVPTSFSLLGVFNIPLITPIGFAIVLLRMIFTTNAVNFSDGLDGLASGISVSALFAMAILGQYSGNVYPATAALVIGFAVLGFLPFNKYRARVYMGDCGAQFLGLSIALLSVGTSPRGRYTLESSLFLAVPALDTAVAVVRRILRGKNPLKADRGHLHHLLLDRGVPHPEASRLLTALSALIATGTLLVIFNT